MVTVVVAVLFVVVLAAVVGGVVWVVLSRQAEASRDATVRAAVDTVYALAGDKLGDQLAAGSRELDHTGQVISQQVAGMAGELTQLRDLVGTLQRERADQQGRLDAQLEEAARRSADLADVTGALRQALASPQSRGQWGERMADDVLRAAGLVEHVSYRRQVTLPSGGRPDVTFLLPRERVLHMDVKFPLDNYLRHLDATDDAERAACEQAFLRDVRARVREVAGRDYVDPATTVGYVLLFIPNESVYGFVHERDPQLVDVALAQRVVLCSPLSLFAVLAVVRQAVDTFLLEQTTDEILACLSGFEKQWQQFSEVLDRLGNQLGTVQRTYDSLSGTRRRQLERQLDEVGRLRAARPSAGDLVAEAIGESITGSASDEVDALAAGSDAGEVEGGDELVA